MTPHRRLLFVIVWLGCALSALAQSPRLDYTLGVRDASRHLYKVSISASNVETKTMDISMPAWTPGWYVIRPYAGNVSKLRVTSGGKPLPFRAVDKQTWQITTQGSRNVQIDYDYYADNREVNGAELSTRGGYFLGTNLFFYVPGKTTNTPTSVRFDLPAGWKVATPLRMSSTPGTYLAKNYDELVDAPTVLGTFDGYTASAVGKEFHLVIDPRGSTTPDTANALLANVQKIVEIQARMFGGLPYRDYWIFFVCGTPNTFSGLEHENSTNIVVDRMPGILEATGMVSHEMFHAWNVKRLKPKAIVPYDYSKEQTVHELWFAEGVTSYYGDLIMRRAGITSNAGYLNGLAEKIETEANAEPERWVSLADSSAITWLGYDGTLKGFTTFAADYYNKGEVVGMMLDLEIRAATQNTKSLDDLMRALYTTKLDFGYTNEDIETTASQLAGISFEGFFAKYIYGTAALDVNSALKTVGLRYNAGRISELPTASPEQRSWRNSWLGG